MAFPSIVSAQVPASRVLFRVVMIALAVVYVASLLGPPPPSVDALAWSTQAFWLFVIWGCWVDRHRVAIRQW